MTTASGNRFVSTSRVTSEVLLETADDRYRRLRRQSRRVIFETQDLLDRGEQRVTRVLRSGKIALDSVASRLE